MMLGIDIGTQSLKALVLDAGCVVRGEHAVGYQPVFPSPGEAEQDPALWERALGPAISGALAAAGRTAESVRSIGIAGQLDGVVAVDDAARPLHPAIIWMDRRAEMEVDGIDAELILQRCGQVLDAGHPAAKIRWLKKRVQARRFHVPVSWLCARLTGEHVIDFATASTTMLYGLAAQGYDPELLSLFGIAERELPAPRAAESLAGALTAEGAALTGLRPGTPVAVGTGDDFSSTLGAGVVTPGRFIDVLGTAEVSGALSPVPSIDRLRLVETHAFIGGQYFIENPGWLCGGAITWFCDTFNVAGPKELDQLAAGVAPGAEGALFIPALSGAMAPEWIAAMRGSFSGLSAAHGRPHLARAVLEGTAFAMKDVLDRVRALGAPVEGLRLAGGGAKSALWAQIRADVAGLPVEIPEHVDTSAIGAALLGGKAAGHIADLAEASARAAPVKAVIPHDSARHAAYAEAHVRYRRTFEAQKKLY